MKPLTFAVYVGVIVVAMGVFLRYGIGSMVRGKVTSWWRTPWHNAKVDGAIFSRHQVGLAIDVSPVTQEDLALFGMVRKFWPLASVVDEKDHLHFQLV